MALRDADSLLKVMIIIGMKVFSSSYERINQAEIKASS